MSETCSLCKKTIKGKVHWSRWYSPVGRKRPFHAKCLQNLEDLFLEDRHMFTILGLLILGTISFFMAYFVDWETATIGYAPIAPWLYYPALAAGVIFIGGAFYVWWHGPYTVSHPHVKRWKKKRKR